MKLKDINNVIVINTKDIKNKTTIFAMNIDNKFNSINEIVTFPDDYTLIEVVDTIKTMLYENTLIILDTNGAGCCVEMILNERLNDKIFNGSVKIVRKTKIESSIIPESIDDELFAMSLNSHLTHMSKIEIKKLFSEMTELKTTVYINKMGYINYNPTFIRNNIATYLQRAMAFLFYFDYKLNNS